MEKEITAFVNSWKSPSEKPIVGILGLNNPKQTTLITHRPNGQDVGSLTDGLLGTHAYILTRDAAIELLRLGGETMKEPVDLFIGSQVVQDAIDVLVIYPNLVAVEDVYDTDTAKD